MRLCVMLRRVMCVGAAVRDGDAAATLPRRPRGASDAILHTRRFFFRLHAVAAFCDAAPSQHPRLPHRRPRSRAHPLLLAARRRRGRSKIVAGRGLLVQTRQCKLHLRRAVHRGDRRGGLVHPRTAAHAAAPHFGVSPCRRASSRCSKRDRRHLPAVAVARLRAVARASADLGESYGARAMFAVLELGERRRCWAGSVNGAGKRATAAVLALGERGVGRGGCRNCVRARIALAATTSRAELGRRSARARARRLSATPRRRSSSSRSRRRATGGRWRCHRNAYHPSSRPAFSNTRPPSAAILSPRRSRPRRRPRSARAAT